MLPAEYLEIHAEEGKTEFKTVTGEQIKTILIGQFLHPRKKKKKLSSGQQFSL